MKPKICIVRGDGIGPEIMDATLKVIESLKVDLDITPLEMGEKVYLSGNSSGITEDAWDKLAESKVLLKAPITTPQGKGYKSLNVTMRKTLGLFSNIRRSLSYDPIIPCRFKNMDVVIFRENEEDLYAGIEHRQTHEVFQCLKLTTTTGSKKIIQAAFEYAVKNGRKRITCMSKDNIMKITDGTFHRIFDEVAKFYPSIETEHMIIDIGAAKLANNPEGFDVVVCQNLYGDILSDITAEISGSVGLAGSMNLGSEYAMFEAIHGSAPDIAGKKLANPTGLMLAAVEMLGYLGFDEAATNFHHAILKTIEDQVVTADISRHLDNVTAVSTDEFTDRVIANLGQRSAKLAHHIHQPSEKGIKSPEVKITEQKDKTLVGVDVFLDVKTKNPQEVADSLLALKSKLELKMITNRGVMVWPRFNPATYCTDHWRCRFQADSVTHQDLADLLKVMAQANIDFIKTEGLFEFDGVAGYSLGQGQ